MKKLFLLQMFVILNIAIYAQFSIGGKAGISLTDIKIDYPDNYIEFHTTPIIRVFNVGIYVNYSFNDWLSVESEINYDPKGARFENSIDKFKLNYFTIIPAMIQIKTRHYIFSNLKLYANIGPYVGFLLPGKTDFGIIRIKDSDYYKSTDFGISIQAGTIFPLKNKMSIFTEASVNIGISNIYKFASSRKNQSIFLNLGVSCSSPLRDWTKISI